jgi:adenosylmethionine---8-amino-7-oxononanoate aminotransferase
MNSQRTRRLVALDKQHVWHPFTQMHEWNASAPLVIERGEGNYLIDTEGRRYLDGVSSLWTNVHGHGRTEIVQAIRDQLDRLAHSTLLGLANVPAVELASALAEVAPPGLDKVFYSDSGSTAVEIALKMAFQYWLQRGRAEKCQFIALQSAYHGDTIGAVSVGGIESFHRIFGPLLFETIRVANPYESHDALTALEDVLARRSHEVAAMVMEPLVQGAAGMLVHPEGYLRQVRELTRRYDVLLIVDEVATGFGRTGRLFACEHEGVSPDLMCLAKGISGGYLPLAATLATEEIYSAFLAPRRDNKQFFHGHTYTGNPLACAAGLASLRLFQSEPILQRVTERAAHLERLLGQRVAGLPAVRQVRQRGLMVGIELGGVAPELAAGAQVCEHVRQNGVILRPLGDVVVLMPPLSIEAAELDTMVDAVAEAVQTVAGMAAG